MKVGTAIAAGLVAVSVAGVSAQRIPWDAPSYFAPRAVDEFGLYASRVVDAATGLSAIWRQGGSLNLGVRAGVADLSKASESVLVGAEFYSGWNVRLPVPLDLTWILGMGAVIGAGHTMFSIPVGTSVGLRLGAAETYLVPYVYPRLSLDIEAVDLDGREEIMTDARPALDAGLDLVLAQRVVVRLGGSLLERDALGVGLAIRWARRALVR